MFERRLKIFLLLLLAGAVVLALRAAQIQVVEHNYWRQKAERMMALPELIQTTRGAIWDRNGKRLAYDAPCVDACVDYRAITEEPDADWVQELAKKRLKARLGAHAYAKIAESVQGKRLVAQECEQIKGDIAALWEELGRVDDKGPDDIAEIRRGIVARVQMREKYLFWRSYEKATAQGEHEAFPAWYRHFLEDNSSDARDADKFEGHIGEETSPHVILGAIGPDVQARLARQERFAFCLSLAPSKTREYPYGRVACHVLGYLGPVRPEEMGANDPFATDELRKYLPNDLIGRAGIEALCEGRLRGVYGRAEKKSEGSDDAVTSVYPVQGQDVKISIDIDLQNDIENEFVKTRLHTDNHGNVEKRFNQHGAAVVIDVSTGEILALASNPGYDPNMLSEQYAAWSVDDLNRPLLDRATQLDVEPGSTVKPIVGSGSITDGYMTPQSTIECKGVLVIGGKPQPTNHCWIYRACLDAHRPISHRSASGDPDLPADDMLTISDALKVSCNVVFETIANKMGMERLSFWFDRFGLGRPTGIGIEESPGRLYRPSDNRGDMPELTWSAGIGEGVVHATPLQMANVAATIARDGIWMRPRLVSDGDVAPAGRRAALGPQRVDLKLSPAALAAVQKGMREVCSTYGSGKNILPAYIQRGPDDPPLDQDPLRGIAIAGKTGTAQTGQLMTIPVRGPNGQILRDGQGNPLYKKVHFGDPGTEGWYLPTNDPDPEKHMAHAWFIGYVPADHPQIAFCVLVEYGEAGAQVAGAIAHDVLVDCIRHQYLSGAR